MGVDVVRPVVVVITPFPLQSCGFPGGKIGEVLPGNDGTKVAPSRSKSVSGLLVVEFKTCFGGKGATR